MPAAADDILLQLAMEAGLVSPSEADAALASAPANACNELILRGVLDASRLNEVLAARFGMTPVDVARVKVPSMIEVGEETGALPDMLVRVADGYDEEVDNAVNALTSLIEPLMIVVMAVMVGTIVIALFLPIVRIIQLLG